VFKITYVKRVDSLEATDMKGKTRKRAVQAHSKAAERSYGKKLHGSQHKQAVLGPHCFSAITRVYQGANH